MMLFPHSNGAPATDSQDDDETRVFDDVAIDLRAGQVRKGDGLLDLEPKAFDLLCHLVENPGRIVTKQELLDTVWKGTAVTDNALTRVVAQLRRAIGDDARQARYIETVPTRGYRFIASVSRTRGTSHIPAGDHAAVTASAGGADMAAAGENAGAAVGARGARMRVAAIAAVAMAMAAAVIVAAVLVTRHDGTNAAAQTWDKLFGVGQVTFSVGLDAYPAFSPDGSLLAFSSSRHGRFELFVKPFAPGGLERQITSDGEQNVQPDWSPDGRYLAYHSLARGGIWIVPATGGAARQIARAGAAPRWSPDGASIAFQSGEVTSVDATTTSVPSALWLLSWPDGTPQQLTRAGEPLGGHGQPAWSPDGARVVFVADNAMIAEIWTIDLATRAQTRLLTCPHGCASPTFARDGRSVYYTTNESTGGLFRVPLAADGRTIAADPIPVYSPADTRLHTIAIDRTGRRVAFGLTSVRSNLEAVRIRADGTADPVLVAITHDTSSRNTAPAFSSDGQRLAFLSRRRGEGEQVWLADSDGSHAQRFTLNEAMHISPTWLSSGTGLTYLALRGEHLDLVTADTNTRQARTLRTIGPWTPEGRNRFASFSILSDGHELLFRRVRDGVSNVWRMHTATGAEEQITRDAEGAFAPIASSSGRWIAYQVKRGADTLVAVAGPDAAREGRVLTPTVERGLTLVGSWAPDEARLAVAFRRDGVWNIGWMSRTGDRGHAPGRVHPLTSFTESAAFTRAPTWSPAGDRIVFEHASITGNVWLAALTADAATSDNIEMTLKQPATTR